MSDDPQTADDEARVNLTVNLPPNAVALMAGIADNPTIVLDLTPSEAELIASTPAQREQRFRETMERLKQFSDSSLLAENLAVSNEILEAIRAQQAKSAALAPPAPPSAPPAAPQPPTATADEQPAADVSIPQYVTLDRMAAMVGRSKRTLEKRKRCIRNPLPEPAVEGGGGKPDEWIWADVRRWLEEEFGRQLPERFPDDRFRDARADRS